jgi:hypothetical protein
LIPIFFKKPELLLNKEVKSIIILFYFLKNIIKKRNTQFVRTSKG